MKQPQCAFENNVSVNAVLDSFEKDSSFVFFNDSKECYYKIYNDGGHHIATLCKPSKDIYPRDRNPKTDLDCFFDEQYLIAVKEGLNKKQLFDFVKTKIIEEFGECLNLDEYITKRIKVKLHNYFARIKRFKRKANLNHWNYFTTFTYDDEKQDEDLFKQRLRKCLSNLHTRRGWKYMGVFERAPITGRLHFHAIMYIPDGEMVGEIEERKDYSTAQHKIQTTYCNTFFEKSFGRNDFKSIKQEELRAGLILNYLIKYINKTNERIVYSRGIKSEICMKLNVNQIVCTFLDFVNKFVLYDDVIDWERDIMHYTYQQVALF